MPPKRVYLVAGPKEVQDEVTLHLTTAKHTVVHKDPPEGPPLVGLGEAKKKGADAVVVFMGREDVAKDGRTGEDVVRRLEAEVPEMSVFSFNRDGGPSVPGIDVHRKRTGGAESYMGLATDVTIAIKRSRYL